MKKQLICSKIFPSEWLGPDSSVGKESIQLPCRRPQFDFWVRQIPWRRDRLHTPVFLGFPCSSAGKESACNVGDPGSIPWLGRSTGEGIGYPLEYSWASLVTQLVKNPPAMWETWVWSWVEKIPWSMGTATTQVFWPGEFLGLYSPWGCKRFGHDWETFTHPPFNPVSPTNTSVKDMSFLIEGVKGKQDRSARHALALVVLVIVSVWDWLSWAFIFSLSLFLSLPHPALAFSV